MIKRDLASADYWRSIGTNEAEISGLVAWELESRQRDAATKAQEAQELANLAWGAVNEGQLSPHDAHALLSHEGKSEAAAAFHDRWDAIEAASSLEEGLATLRGMSAAEHRQFIADQRAAAERDAYAQRYAETEAQNEKLADAALDAAKRFGPLAEQVSGHFAEKIARGQISELSPETVAKDVAQAGREVAIATERLAMVDEQLEQKWKNYGKSFGMKPPWNTDAQKANARSAFMAEHRAHELERYQLTADEVAAPATAEEERQEILGRVQGKAAFSKDFDRNAANMLDRGRALEAERKRPRNLLAGRYGNAPASEPDEVVIA